MFFQGKYIKYSYLRILLAKRIRKDFYVLVGEQEIHCQKSKVELEVITNQYPGRTQEGDSNCTTTQFAVFS